MLFYIFAHTTHVCCCSCISLPRRSNMCIWQFIYTWISNGVWAVATQLSDSSLRRWCLDTLLTSQTVRWRRVLLTKIHFCFCFSQFGRIWCSSSISGTCFSFILYVNCFRASLHFHFESLRWWRCAILFLANDIRLSGFFLFSLSHFSRVAPSSSGS